MTVNVIDAGCGIGKTTAMINTMNQDLSNQKYFFITPFLDEIQRIKKSCPNKNFKEPEAKGSKLKDLLVLLENGENIVTTHSLFKKLNHNVLDIIKKNDYILIMDEVADTIEELNITKSDLDIITNKYTNINPRTHILEWKDDEYTGKLSEYMHMIKMNSVFAYTFVKNEKLKVVSIMWMFPYSIFESFKSVYVLTYMFNYQIQKKYFDYYQTNYKQWYIKDFKLTDEKQVYDYSKTKSLINICENDKINKIGEGYYALSKSWMNSNKKGESMVRLKKNIYNFLRWHAKGKCKNIIWTTFKSSKNDLKSKGYTRAFAAINLRATNLYKDKNIVVYVGNRFLKPTIKNFMSFNEIDSGTKFEEGFALSELIQFIYRSAIRDNKPITIYLPSKRMRNLLKEWIKKPNE